MNDSREGAGLRLGLLLNPWAGIGGPAGLRGSDGAGIREAALARGAMPAASQRAARFLAALDADAARHTWVTWGGDMGADLLATVGLSARVCGMPVGALSTADDTQHAARALADAGIDLLLFVGGDGTARDVCTAIGTRVAALGIPAGVKMYSGVFAVSPEAAADVVRSLQEGIPVELETREVRDIDEDAFRNDRVASRYFGEMNVPGLRGRLQQVKCAAPPVAEIARTEIAAGVLERLAPGTLLLVGTGSTPKAVMGALGLPASLLGIDAVQDGRLLASDVIAADLLPLLAQHPQRQLLLTATGGQGFLLGRGNQQLSPEVLRELGAENLVVVATPEKLTALEGRPLLVDTGDTALDASLAGLHPVWTGYESRVLYRVAAAHMPA